MLQLIGLFMNGLRVFLLLGMMLLSAPVWAEATVAQIEALTAAEMPKVGSILLQQQRNLGVKCANVKVLKASALSITEPVVLGADGKPTAGSWHVRYVVDACGTAGLRMVGFTAVKGRVAMDALVPGETLADRKLQDDVMRSFALAGQVAMPKCGDEPVIRETKVRVYPQTAKDKWQEIWIGRMCGRDLGQLVDFMPTKDGTTFKMSVPNYSAK